MATASELRKEIKLIEKALAVKSLSDNMKTKLRAKLATAKADLKAGGGKKSTPKGGVSSAKKLQDLLKTIKNVGNSKRLSAYKNSGVDIPKDAGRPALPKGRRISKNGKPYTENRPNRYDVKQPPKTYPKLEDGGYMAGGGLVAYAEGDYDKKLKEFNSLDSAKKFAKANNSKYETITFEDEYGDNIVVSKDDSSVDIDWLFNQKMAKGGYMAGGGKIKDQYEGREAEDIWNNLSKTQRQHFLYDHASEIEDYRGEEFGKLKSAEIIKAYNSDYSNLDKHIRNRFENHVREGQYAKGGYMAKGGLTQHGLEYGDKIINSSGGNVIEVESKSGDRFLINLDKGTRLNKKEYTMDSSTTTYKDFFKAKGGYMAGGGKLKFTTMTEESFLEKYGTATNNYPQSVENTFDIISYGSPIKERREGFLSAMKMNGYNVKVDGEFAVAVRKRNIKKYGGYMANGGDIHRTEMGA